MDEFVLEWVAVGIGCYFLSQDLVVEGLLGKIYIGYLWAALSPA